MGIKRTAVPRGREVRAWRSSLRTCFMVVSALPDIEEETHSTCEAFYAAACLQFSNIPFLLYLFSPTCTSSEAASKFKIHQPYIMPASACRISRPRPPIFPWLTSRVVDGLCCTDDGMVAGQYTHSLLSDPLHLSSFQIMYKYITRPNVTPIIPCVHGTTLPTSSFALPTRTYPGQQSPHHHSHLEP